MGTRLEGSGHFCRSPFLLPNRHTILSSELNKKKWHYHPMTAWLERPSVAVSRDSLSRHGIPVFRVLFRDRNILQTNTTEQSTLITKLAKATTLREELISLVSNPGHRLQIAFVWMCNIETYLQNQINQIKLIWSILSTVFLLCINS